MLEKAADRKSQKGGENKRRHTSDDGQGREKKRRGAEDGQKGLGDGGKKRLDALSVGYFRRVGERLNEGFEDDEERGENEYILLDLNKYIWPLVEGHMLPIQHLND